MLTGFAVDMDPEKAIHPTPPQFAKNWLRLLAPTAFADAMLGDMEEEFVDQYAHSGADKARRWYWSQVLLSTPALVGRVIRVQPIFLTFISVIAGALALKVWITFALYLFRKLYEINLFQGSVTAALSTRLAIELLGFYVAGYVLGRIVRHAPARFAKLWIAGLFVLWMLLALPPLWLEITGEVPMPVWYRVAWFVLMLPSLWAGTLTGKRH